MFFFFSKFWPVPRSPFDLLPSMFVGTIFGVFSCKFCAGDYFCAWAKIVKLTSMIGNASNPITQVRGIIIRSTVKALSWRPLHRHDFSPDTCWDHNSICVLCSTVNQGFTEIGSRYCHCAAEVFPRAILLLIITTMKAAVVEPIHLCEKTYRHILVYRNKCVKHFFTILKICWW